MTFPYASRHTSLYIISVWDIGNRNIGTYRLSGFNHGLTTGVKELAWWITSQMIYKRCMKTIPFCPARTYISDLGKYSPEIALPGTR